MKKKIVEGNVGVIILKDSTDYAKSMALKDEKVARMDKDLVEFLMDDTERLKRGSVFEFNERQRLKHIWFI